jgi:hypothetical protein
VFDSLNELGFFVKQLNQLGYHLGNLSFEDLPRRTGWGQCDLLNGKARLQLVRGQSERVQGLDGDLLFLGTMMPLRDAYRGVQAFPGR